MIESIVLTNLILEQSIAINQDNGPYWLNEVDFGQVQNTIHTFKFVNQVGETIYNTSLEARPISISGWVAAWDREDVIRLKKQLNHFINPKHLIDAYTNGMKIQFQPQTSIQYSPTYQENNEVLSKFLITGYCPYPMFTDETPRTVSVAYTEKKFRFPLIIPKNKGILFGIRHPSLIAEVTNNGDMPIGYTIEFRASGNVVNPSLIDIGSQQFIKINKTLVSGETVTINTREGYRQIKGSIGTNKETNYFKYRTFDSSWLQLEQGINYLRYAADDGIDLLEVYIQYEPAYFEVDV